MIYFILHHAAKVGLHFSNKPRDLKDKEQEKSILPSKHSHSRNNDHPSHLQQQLQSHRHNNDKMPHLPQQHQSHKANQILHFNGDIVFEPFPLHSSFM